MTDYFDFGAELKRREFLRQVGAGLVGVPLASSVMAAGPEVPTTAPATSPSISNGDIGSIQDLPKRRLGRIGIDVPPLSLGTAPMGHMYYEPEPFEQVVNAAIDAGITYLDTAYIYDVAELRLAPILAKRRDEVFLVTKTWVQSKDQALASLEKSIQLMEVDSVDLTLIHNVGGYEREQVLGKNGSLAGLLEARKRGWTKHIGCSGHCFPDKFVPVIETGEIDLVMCAMNFVHEHVYGFQERVVPTVVKHDAALVCMKVYGGATGGWGGYAKGNPGRLASAEYRQDAVDYALSIPHVSTCVVGMKTLQELQAGIVAFRNHRPLDGARREEVIRRGKELAEEWGPQFGAVT